MKNSTQNQNQKSIDENKQAADVLKLAAQQWQNTLNAVNDVIWLLDTNHRILHSNSATEKHLQRRAHEIIGKYCWEIVHGTCEPIPECPILRAKKSLHRETMELQIDQRWFHIAVDPILDESGRLTQYIHIMRDITLRKHREELLRESEERYRLLFELSPDAIAVHQDGRIVFVNQAAAKLVGAAKPEDLIGIPMLDFVHPDYRPLVIERARLQFVENKTVPPTMEKFLRLDGTTADVEVVAAPFHYKGRVASLVIIRDVSERMQAQEKIRAALEEKEVLLREVHHRVKNNLQAIISLMDIRIMQIKSENTRRFLRELQEQARTMSLVYEQLYQSDNLAQVAMQPYLQQIAVGVLQAFGGDRKINLDLQIAQVAMDVSLAMPCGLIVNELVNNALKYAFPASYSGNPSIHVSLNADHNRYTLTVSDNGIGFPTEIDFHSIKSLGLRLVNMWVTHQLGGDLKVTSDNGASFLISFTAG